VCTVLEIRWYWGSSISTIVGHCWEFLTSVPASLSLSHSVEGKPGRRIMVETQRRPLGRMQFLSWPKIPFRFCDFLTCSCCSVALKTSKTRSPVTFWFPVLVASMVVSFFHSVHRSKRIPSPKMARTFTS
jgi:hypothetical protein